MNYLSLCLFAIAAFSNAVLDILTFNYSKSIFKDLDASFWNPNESWKTATNVLSYVRIDGYHIIKYLFIGSLIATVITFQPIYNFISNAFFYSFIWGLCFELPTRLMKKQ